MTPTLVSLSLNKSPPLPPFPTWASLSQATDIERVFHAVNERMRHMCRAERLVPCGRVASAVVVVVVVAVCVCVCVQRAGQHQAYNATQIARRARA